MAAQDIEAKRLDRLHLRIQLAQFRERAFESLALDHAGSLVYLAPTRINLGLTIERWPELLFRETREHLAAAA